MNLFYPKKKKKSCTMNPFLLCDKKNCNIVQYHMASGDTHYDCIFFFNKKYSKIIWSSKIKTRKSKRRK